MRNARRECIDLAVSPVNVFSELRGVLPEHVSISHPNAQELVGDPRGLARRRVASPKRKAFWGPLELRSRRREGGGRLMKPGSAKNPGAGHSALPFRPRLSLASVLPMGHGSYFHASIRVKTPQICVQGKWLVTRMLRSGMWRKKMRIFGLSGGAPIANRRAEKTPARR